MDRFCLYSMSTLYFVLVCWFAGLSSAAQQAAFRPSKCPLSVHDMVSYAPDASVKSVKEACASPKNSNFCEACICTAREGFLPATLTSAGAIDNTTSPEKEQELLDACFGDSSRALMILGAVNSDSAAALLGKCDGSRDKMQSPTACQRYKPQSLPAKAAARRKAAMCPFGSDAIKKEELLSVQKACGNNSGIAAFCRSCSCGINAAVNTAINKRKDMFTAKDPTVDPSMLASCWQEIMQAMDEHDVLSDQQRRKLSSSECKDFAKVAAQAPEDACGEQIEEAEETEETKATQGASPAATAQATAPAEGKTSQRSAAATTNPTGSFCLSVTTALALMFISGWVGLMF